MTSLNDFFPLYHTILRYQFYGLFSYTNPFPVTITPLLQSLKTMTKHVPLMPIQKLFVTWRIQRFALNAAT